MLDTEQLFDQCVAKAGGKRVKTIVGPSPPFKDADYVFETDNVIAELKSLQKDFLSDAGTREKMHLLYNKWVDQGKVPLAFGQTTIDSGILPPECQRELVSLFKNPLETPLNKANTQIRETKANLKMPDAIGMLLLSNDGNFALDPAMTIHVLHHSLKVKFSQIEHVLMFSGNLTTGFSSHAIEVFPFISVAFQGRRTPSEVFLNKLASCWRDVLCHTTGRDLPPFSGFRRVTTEQIDTARYHVMDFVADAANPGWVKGFGVVRESPWHFAGLFKTRIEAEAERSKLGSSYVVAYGSHRSGSDDFMWSTSS